jgi:hypothetical protein
VVPVYKSREIAFELWEILQNQQELHSQRDARQNYEGCPVEMRIYPPIEDAARADDGDNSPRMEFWKFVHPPIIRRRAG